MGLDLDVLLSRQMRARRWVVYPVGDARQETTPLEHRPQEMLWQILQGLIGFLVEARVEVRTVSPG